MLVMVFSTARVFYNLRLHPLAAYKGPMYLVASGVSLAILQLAGTSQYNLKAAHDRYGAAVRIVPGTLSYIDPQAWVDIYSYKKNGGGRANLPKDPQFYNEMVLSKETITLVSHVEAVPIRRALNAAFSHRALLEQENMLPRHVNQLMLRLSAFCTNGHSVDIHKWFTFSSFDINSDFGFGEDMGCVSEGEYHEWVKFVMDYFYAATLLHQCHKFWPLNRLFSFCIPSSVKEMQKKHSEASLIRVRKRMSTETERRDLMYYFMKQAEKEGLSRRTIKAQATVLILAGSETSSVALTAAVYYTLSHIHVYEKLRKEIRDAFVKSEACVLQDVLTLPYLNAVLQETLRIHAPLANGFTRYVPDREGARICGRHVPQATVVAINHYCSNTSAANFRTPLSFVPARWMGEIAYKDDKRDVVQLFSFGPRNCPGRSFALNGIKLTLAHLIWRFDMRLDECTRDWATGQKVFNGWLAPPFPILLENQRDLHSRAG
ncbi:MAG: hypothetical protein M1828_001058 [Chrysothrix sp. TS-e1954]|nr:MAG: hypothetical protein M1828_001058 [Chrysothrix sp. TS-e1954]